MALIMRKTTSKQSGFTLIELLIVVAIIGILGAIGYNSYSKYMVESRRGEATSRLLQLAQSQEKYYLNNNSYTKTLSDLGVSNNQTTNDNYTISLSTSSADQRFTITATVNTGGAQSSDTACNTIWINSRNQRGANSECWN